jgi:outer membrane biosynthesis protein TonB
MRCLFAALLIAFAAQIRAQEVLHATDDDLRTASQVYAESAAKEVKRHWLLLRSKYRDKKITGSLTMSVQVGPDGKLTSTQVVEKEGEVSQLEKLTLLAVNQAQLKPLPHMLAKGLVVRGMKMPSFQVTVPFEEASGKDQARADGANTPKGRYIRKVTQAVEKKWHLFRTLMRDQVTYGALKVVFYVTKEGKVEDVKVVEDNTSNPVLTDFTLKAIRAAEIPPMPNEAAEMLPLVDKQRLKIEYQVLIY